MRPLIVITLSALILCNPASLFAQSKGCTETELLERRSLKEVKERPDLGIDYARVTNFKLASRKTTYRMDDMISIDMAMLNTASVPLFFPHLLDASLTIFIRDEKGVEVAVNPYDISSGIATPAEYDKLLRNDIVIGSLEFIAGCDTKVEAHQGERIRLIEDTSSGKMELYKSVFERDLFTNWGYGCIRFAGPGTYTITAEMTSDYVVTSPCESEVKTATGKIRSLPLKISIIE